MRARAREHNAGGLLDPLMGSVDRRHLCATCMRDARSCQGHAGHLELSYPAYHFGFVETVLKTLRTTCFFCARVCATEEDAQVVRALPGKQRLAALHAALRTRKACPHCGAPRPAYARTPLGLRCDWPEATEWQSDAERDHCTAPFTAREALSILRHVPDADAALLGFDGSHPKTLILQVLVVPPPCTRPAIYSSEGSRSRGQNDLTVKLLEILKRSQELGNALGNAHWRDVDALTPDHLERIARLQYELYTLVSSNVRAQKPGGSHRGNGAPCKSLTERLKGKEGRVRGNLMGKRVDFSARCVITPDAYFDCDRVGVPYKIAKGLTVPETVNATNIRALSHRVRLGADDVHGAESVVSADGTVVTHLAHCRDRAALVLKPGDVVERFLADDDVVVFNRQPSLHMHGMQCHKVRLMPGNTFRLSLPVATPYNADFDGDEMNLHVPQSKAAQAECATLMAVANNVVGAQANKPVMGLVQDTLLALHMLTQPDVLFDHAHACRILAGTRHAPKRLPPPAAVVVVGGGGGGGGAPVRYWTGKQLFSALLPADLYVEPDKPPHDAEWSDASLPVVVRGGALLCGVLRKAHVGTASGGIVDVLCRERGGVACMRFMGDAQRLGHAFLLQRAHHVGIADVVLGAEGQERVHARLAKATQLCEEIQREIDSGDVADVAQTGERAILRLLSKTLMQTGGIVNEHMSETNAIRRMVTAGSKGSFINLSQICAALGQQSLEGARIVAEKGTRTLPCFKPNDVSLASRGMVHNSFALGLTPPELFMHGIGGREGLVDTAVKTSQTGYLQRRMNKSMEDARVHDDGTVRNAMDEVVSFRWGSDGLHPARLERATLALLTEPEASVCARMTPAEAELALACRRDVLRTKTHVLATELDARVLLPFHPRRAARRIAREADPADPVDPAAASARVLTLARAAPRAVAAAFLDSFCASRVAGMGAAAHARLLDELEARLDAARAPPGESVGCLAAQSVGEPCTQSAPPLPNPCARTHSHSLTVLLSFSFSRTVTLNSVDWETHMVIRWTAREPPPAPADAHVGAFVDALLEALPQNVQWQDATTAYLPLPPGTAMALSPDEDGRMQWTPLEAVTRHPPVNKDGSNTLLKIKAANGHEVVVTKGKSLLVERDGKLVQVDGEQVRLGDRVPVVAELLPDTTCDTLDLRTLFKATEVLFTDEVVRAMEIRDSSASHSWWHGNGFETTLPYHRSDSFVIGVRRQPQLLQPGMVATVGGTVNPNKKKTTCMLPAMIPLDRAFGFFLGAYLAEGCTTNVQVHISNVDADYQAAVREWPERHGIHWHETNESRRYVNGGYSMSIMFHSTILVRLVDKVCGKTSYGKRVPGFAFAAPDVFVEGLLDGYLSGDGSVDSKGTSITASSRSRALRDGIALLMARFGAATTLGETGVPNHVHNTVDADGEAHRQASGELTPLYHLRANMAATATMAKHLRMTITRKQERLEKALRRNGKHDKVRHQLRNVYLDEIVAITEQPSSHEFVYDLTVAGTKNMCAVNGVGLADTCAHSH